MNKYHKIILEKIKKAEKKDSNHPHGARYVGTTHNYYNVPTPERSVIIKEFVKANNLNFKEYIDLIYSLNNGKSYEEIVSAVSIIYSYPMYIEQIKIKDINSWLKNLVGWAEVDTLCAGIFDSKMILKNLDNWYKFLINLSKSKNINKRRASLVLLIKPIREIHSEELSNLAFLNINTLKHEKHILITKAISWILREMTKNYRNEVIDYLKNNKQTLPAIAVRETNNKLKTGRK
ncbi:hypothetical protein COV24_02830 [candidate division WWE3 bacterium CG10_big_fil_rev_8_21_14_0_10_32_10]|uniref:DNA alkylation repair protein n=1 Tax=candidate division WWE3 bacterium CG10_big_fil_rev_8_21_14_0_10_32_10 TaxID=1975090 RepID=A0A2H0RA92_UNCKA|nr:MAG: hypothetical protein COV24_02830 [candidate division WWE3 bacterium CG10_big_fil_rev_8_21_14_0_10_32_10]